MTSDFAAKRTAGAAGLSALAIALGLVVAPKPAAASTVEINAESPWAQVDSKSDLTFRI